MEIEWRKTRAYRLWRAFVIRRDKACKCCGGRKGRHAHHIKSAAFWPELKFDVSNGVTLCNDCHKYIHNQIAGGYREICDRVHLEILFQLSWHRRILRRKHERVLKDFIKKGKL